MKETGSTPFEVQREKIRKFMDDAYQFGISTQLSGQTITEEYPSISLDTIYAFGTDLLNETSLESAYSKLATESPLAETSWYDITLGQQHKSLCATLSRALREELHGKVRRSLDIATGTGLQTEALVGVSRHITALDTNPDMLYWADKRLTRHVEKGHIEGYEIVHADAQQLSTLYSENTFSLITSSGLVPYLNKEQMEDYFQQAYTVLNDGGLYCLPLIESTNIVEHFSGNYGLSPQGLLLAAVGGGAIIHSQSIHDTSLLTHNDLSQFGFAFFKEIEYPNQNGTVQLWQKV